MLATTETLRWRHQKARPNRVQKQAFHVIEGEEDDDDNTKYIQIALYFILVFRI